ncbi:hypothetical protein PHLCEN_2v928 [Hermanssonia centrifuga]|uniref:HMG box domain-containing protein n=1 Tax=Hermanssonia centrifuga TaxID=98765 RepID=A0A2R6S4U5_9APHY|nr:hypothetical protein PHLCEN_2v928 [Hermanssonia centrifuga]
MPAIAPSQDVEEATIEQVICHLGNRSTSYQPLQGVDSAAFPFLTHSLFPVATSAPSTPVDSVATTKDIRPPVNCFFLYCAAFSELNKDKYKNRPELCKAAAQSWSALSDKEKAPYRAEAKSLKDHYTRHNSCPYRKQTGKQNAKKPQHRSEVKGKRPFPSAKRLNKKDDVQPSQKTRPDREPPTTSLPIIRPCDDHTRISSSHSETFGSWSGTSGWPIAPSAVFSPRPLSYSVSPNPFRYISRSPYTPSSMSSVISSPPSPSPYSAAPSPADSEYSDYHASPSMLSMYSSLPQSPSPSPYPAAPSPAYSGYTSPSILSMSSSFPQSPSPSPYPAASSPANSEYSGYHASPSMLSMSSFPQSPYPSPYPATSSPAHSEYSGYHASPSMLSMSSSFPQSPSPSPAPLTSLPYGSDPLASGFDYPSSNYYAWDPASSSWEHPGYHDVNDPLTDWLQSIGGMGGPSVVYQGARQDPSYGLTSQGLDAVHHPIIPSDATSFYRDVPHAGYGNDIAGSTFGYYDHLGPSTAGSQGLSMFSSGYTTAELDVQARAAHVPRISRIARGIPLSAWSNTS